LAGALPFLWIHYHAEQSQASAVALHELHKVHSQTLARLQSAEAENQALRSQLESLGAPPVEQHSVPRGASTSSALETVRRLASTQQQLADTKATLQTAQLRVQQLEAALEQTRADSASLKTAATEAREEADSLRRENASIETELKSKAERADGADAAARRAQTDSAEAKQKVSLVASTLHDLDDLARRRDNYLTSLQRRYRDVNDQLRSLSARLDRYRDSNSAPAISTDLPRLQAVIQASEEDLRQVQTLNAQALRLTQRLPQK
jgi:chromosome segregation ATPase